MCSCCICQIYICTICCCSAPHVDTIVSLMMEQSQLLLPSHTDAYGINGMWASTTNRSPLPDAYARVNSVVRRHRGVAWRNIWRVAEQVFVDVVGFVRCTKTIPLMARTKFHSQHTRHDDDRIIEMGTQWIRRSLKLQCWMYINQAYNWMIQVSRRLGGYRTDQFRHMATSIKIKSRFMQQTHLSV